MSSLRVLITNLAVAHSSGTETYVRDLAAGLTRLGHRPIVYSTVVGPLGEEIAATGTAVVDDLARLRRPPDVIHGNHHHETMTALLHFPGVPGVFFCHDRVAWHDEAPLFPRLRRYVAVDDCGPQINPMIVEGQVHGGVVQGIGQALWEEAVYDETGQLVTGTLMDYAIPRADVLPDIEVLSTVTPSPHHPLGVKGIGEAGTIASTCTVYNAVVDATRNATQVRLGASMRGAMALARTSRVWAIAHDRNYVTPDDVKTLADAVLAHRLILDPEAEFDGVTATAVIGQILLDTPPPSHKDLE